MKGSSWKIQVGRKPSNKYLYKRKAEANLRQKRREYTMEVETGMIH